MMKTLVYVLRSVLGSRALPLVLLVVHGGLLAWSAAWHSPATDELAHLPSGVYHWQTLRFDMDQVNPPLVRMLAAVPVVLANPTTNWQHTLGFRPEWSVCFVFAEENRERLLWYFTMARWACIPLSLIGCCVCFRWATELYGRPAGVLALSLWCFCPNVLGNAAMITPDTGAAALGVTAGYWFWRWLKQPSRWSAVAAGMTLGLAELTKSTWVVLFLLWPVLWLAWRWSGRGESSGQPWLRGVGQLAGILLLGLYLLNLGYGFDGSFCRLGEYHFLSRMLQGSATSTAGGGGQVRMNRFAGSWLGELPVPLPEDYLLGIDIQKKDFESNFWSYLRGEWRQRGWWYYYLYGLAIKVPLGTWMLLVLALVFRVCFKGFAAPWRDELVLLAPLAVVLTLVSSHTGFNHHLRYILPIFPFAFIWTSAVARSLAWGNWKVTALVMGALTWSLASSLWVYPHSMSYFNELVGGPMGGHNHLLLSNIDWEQDYLFLKRWADDHPEARPLWLVEIDCLEPSLIGLDTEPPPHELRPGWYAIRVSRLHHRTQKNYSHFLRYRPVAMAGYSIYVYHLSLEEANEVRRELGQSELLDLPLP